MHKTKSSIHFERPLVHNTICRGSKKKLDPAAGKIVHLKERLQHTMSCDGLHIMFICFTIIISTNTSFPTLRIPTCMQETQLAKILVINSRLCNQNVPNIGLGQMLIWYIIRFFFFFFVRKTTVTVAANYFTVKALPKRSFTFKSPTGQKQFATSKHLSQYHTLWLHIQLQGNR